MKYYSKIIVVLLSVMMILTMSACAEKNTANESAKEDAPKEVDYSSMQQGEEPLEIYEGTSMEIGAIGSVEPTPELLKEVDAIFSDPDTDATYAQVSEIMGCHGKMRPEDDGDFNYIAYDWEHDATEVSIVVTFHLKEDGTYSMNAHSTFPPGVLSE